MQKELGHDAEGLSLEERNGGNSRAGIYLSGAVLAWVWRKKKKDSRKDKLIDSKFSGGTRKELKLELERKH